MPAFRSPTNSRRSSAPARTRGKAKRTPRLEQLESRCLPTASFFQPGQLYDTTPPGSGRRALVAEAADVNGDGKPDLVVVNGGPSGVQILAGNGDGTFNRNLTPVATVGYNYYALAVVDVNG